MTGHDDASETPRESGVESVVEQMFPWLLRQKITVPDRVPGYVHRAELVRRTLPTRRRLTVLNASSGFGKTTLLAECCRSLRQDGVATAWVSLDELDEPAVLDTYIAFACQYAGLSLLDGSNLEGTSSGPESRVGVVLRQIQTLGRPFVIAFDELERLTNPASVSLLEFLLQRGPSNLHLAIACRQIPDGLNVAGAVLDGRAEVVATNELRFSKPEVAKFFDLSLSRSELTAEMDRSAGWPFALRISLNRTEHRSAGDNWVVQDFVKNWVESRLFASLGPDDRDFLLDIGLFDWIDAALLDEVLQRNDSIRRLHSTRVLVGLLEPVGGGATESWRLHPLVREHCARQRFQETPKRFGAIHRRIAEALMVRGETVAAMRHAIEGGEPVLAGEILERSGGVRLWVRQGLLQLQAADRLLSDEVISMRPRLALVRCLVVLMSGRLDQARELFRELAATRPASRQDGPDADFEYSVDRYIVYGAMAIYGGEPVGADSVRTLLGDFSRLVESQRLDPLTRGHLEYGLSVLHQLKAEFDIALELLAGAGQVFAHSQYMMMHGHLLRGQIAMARGQVQEAESHYRRGQRMARKGYVLDPGPMAGARIMSQELALECSAASSAGDLRTVPRAFMTSGVPFSVIAAASGLVIDLRLRDGRADLALAAVDELLEYVRGTGLTALIRYLTALRTSVLVIAGRVEDAERAWRLENLPRDAKGCVDLAGQGWREMEAISSARLHCLIARERFNEGRDLAREFRAVAIERRLRRTQMRASALSMVLEQRSGDPESAVGNFQEFLGLFAESPYAWPLVRERSTCAAVVTKFLDLHPDSPDQDTARSLLAAMRRVDEVRELALSAREREVLRRLHNQRDKQIAAALGLTVSGVRHHLRKLFAKLGVGRRAEAVGRARELGLIADDS